MKFAIKNHWTGAVIFEADLSAEYERSSKGVKLGAAVKLAVRERANLAGAYLARANLAGANQRGPATDRLRPCGDIDAWALRRTRENAA